MYWIATFLSVVGGVLNARQYVTGFYFWIVANVLWIIEALTRPEGPAWPLIVTWVTFTVIAIHGIRKWRKPKEEQ